MLRTAIVRALPRPAVVGQLHRQAAVAGELRQLHVDANVLTERPAAGLRTFSVSAGQLQDQQQRRSIATSPLVQIEQTAVNQAEGEYAQTKDTVIQVRLPFSPSFGEKLGS